MKSCFNYITGIRMSHFLQPPFFQTCASRGRPLVTNLSEWDSKLVRDYKQPRKRKTGELTFETDKVKTDIDLQSLKANFLTSRYPTNSRSNLQKLN